MRLVNWVFASLLLVVARFAFAAGPDLAAFQNWANSAKMSGYTFGGVDQPDPGIKMAIWMNPKGEMLAVRLEPASNLKSYLQTTNKKKPATLTYKGMPAYYTDALSPSAMLVVNYERSGQLLVFSNQNQPKAMSREQLESLLDTLKPEALFK